MISQISSQIFCVSTLLCPPPRLLIPHFSVRLESLLLIGPLRLDVAMCCDENQIFRQEVDDALISNVANVSVGSCVGNVMWG